MASTGLEVFDTTLHRTSVWLKGVMDLVATEDRQLAYLGLRATLHAVRDRLPPAAAVHLGAQLPMLVRGFYYDGWRPSVTPATERQPEQFLDHVRAGLPSDAAGRAEPLARASLAVLSAQVDRGEALKILRMMPTPLRALWPQDLTANVP